MVGRPDDLTGEAVCAFVVLKRARPSGDEAKKIANELRNWVAKEIGPIAKPKDIRFGDNLPKTRTGKIMRRLLRSIAKGEAITQDTSTLENPAILEQLAQPTDPELKRRRASAESAGFRRRLTCAQRKLRRSAASFRRRTGPGCGASYLRDSSDDPGRQRLGLVGIDLRVGRHRDLTPYAGATLLIFSASLAAASFWPAYLAATSLYDGPTSFLSVWWQARQFFFSASCGWQRPRGWPQRQQSSR